MDDRYFLRPSGFERVFNRTFGALIRLGIGLRHNYVLEVRGRKSGNVYTAPVNLIAIGGRDYLVAPRGETNWVRNARAAGRIALVKGLRRREFTLRELAVTDRPPILKAYLDRYAPTVQRYFPIPKGSPADSFKELAVRYPVFELTAANR